MAGKIRDFEIAIDQSVLDDLQDRLAHARFPDKETVDDWDQGIPLAYVRELTEYWRTDYDWRRCEAALNSYSNHLVEIDGVDIHFLHIRSPEPDAKPLLITHGWPGSQIEFLDVIGPLTDPAAHGAAGAQAFHLILPALPGFGFSGKPTQTGWSIEKIADVWDELMSALGYDVWLAQGGDWGAMVTAAIGAQNKGGCKAIHLNMVVAAPPPEVMSDPTPDEQAALARLALYRSKGSGYSTQQSSRPQTIGYALADSAVGQMAWVMEKFQDWSDCDGHPEPIFRRDALLDNVMLYWLGNAGASSARLYWHSFGLPDMTPVTIPTGCSIYPHEIMRASRRWAETRFKNIIHWSEQEKGGHFAAMERPELYINEVRSCFAKTAL